MFVISATADKNLNIKNAPLWMGKKSNDKFTVYYKTTGEILVNGPGYITVNSLVLELTKEQLYIYICCNLPDKGAKAGDETWILNGAVVTNGQYGYTLMYNILLIKDIIWKESNCNVYLNKPIESIK